MAGNVGRLVTPESYPTHHEISRIVLPAREIIPSRRIGMSLNRGAQWARAEYSPINTYWAPGLA